MMIERERERGERDKRIGLVLVVWCGRARPHQEGSVLASRGEQKEDLEGASTKGAKWTQPPEWEREGERKGGG